MAEQINRVVIEYGGSEYEFDGDGNWDLLERVLERVAGRKDIFLGTNREVLL